MPIREGGKKQRVRNWSFDYCWFKPIDLQGLRPSPMECPFLAFELDGGIWSNGRHNRGQGFIDDIAKINAAQMLGWRVFRITYPMIADKSAVTLMRSAWDRFINE